MCRSVIIAVIFASFVSCVLAETADHVVNTEKEKNATDCKNHPTVAMNRQIMRRCFNKLVDLHLNSSTELKPEDCKNVTDFVKKLRIFLDSMVKECNPGFKLDSTKIEKLIDYSLQNDSFKIFYENIDCVQKVEFYISNTCVRPRLGHFNITKESKHLSWARKAFLQYDKNTCDTSQHVRDCVVGILKPCNHTTTEYVTKLFDYARELGQCSQFPALATVPPPIGSADPWDAVPWLTIPVIITLGIGGVVVVAAIITIIVLKCKN